MYPGWILSHVSTLDYTVLLIFPELLEASQPAACPLLLPRTGGGR